MPELGAGQYLLDALMEAGPTQPGAMGDQVPLEWADLHAYRECAGTVSEVWELRALYRMSREYLAGQRQGENPLGREPMDER